MSVVVVADCAAFRFAFEDAGKARPMIVGASLSFDAKRVCGDSSDLFELSRLHERNQPEAVRD